MLWLAVGQGRPGAHGHQGPGVVPGGGRRSTHGVPTGAPCPTPTTPGGRGGTLRCPCMCQWGKVSCLLFFCIVYGSTKGFVSYGGFTHVGFPLRTSVSPPTLYPSSLQLPLSPLSPSPVTTFPSSSPSCSPLLFLTRRSHSIRFTRAQGIPKYKIGFWEWERMGELGKDWSRCGGHRWGGTT